MNGERTFFLIGTIGLVVISRAFAQSDNPVPKSPYIAPASDYGHWTIKMKYPAPPSVPGQPAQTPALGADKPIGIDTIGTGNVRRITLSFAGEPSEEIYEKDGTFFIPTGRGILMTRAASEVPGEGPYPFYSPGFLFAGWVCRNGLSSFKDVVTYNEARCFHYQEGGDEAWIDVNTMLPVATKQDGIEADYQFMAPPTSPLQLPPDEASALQKTVDAYKAVNATR
jgi:hypothetical protein